MLWSWCEYVCFLQVATENLKGYGIHQHVFLRVRKKHPKWSGNLWLLGIVFFSISSIEKNTPFFAMSKPTKNIWVMNSEILKMGIPTYLQVGAVITKPLYCWWKKSCTTRDVSNLVNNGINCQPQLVSRILAIRTLIHLEVDVRSGWPSHAKRQSCGISICQGDRANELSEIWRKQHIRI